MQDVASAIEGEPWYDRLAAAMRKVVHDLGALLIELLRRGGTTGSST